MKVLELNIEQPKYEGVPVGTDQRIVNVTLAADSLAEALQVCAQLSNVTLSKAPGPTEPTMDDPGIFERAHQRIAMAKAVTNDTDVAGNPVPKRWLVAPRKATAGASITSAPAVTDTKTATSASAETSLTPAPSTSIGAAKPLATSPSTSPKSSSQQAVLPVGKTEAQAEDTSFPFGASVADKPVVKGLDIPRILKCKTLKDIIVELQASGIETTVEAMEAKCKELVTQVPLLSKISNMGERVARTMQILGLLDEVDDSEDEDNA